MSYTSEIPYIKDWESHQEQTRMLTAQIGEKTLGDEEEAEDSVLYTYFHLRAACFGGLSRLAMQSECESRLGNRLWE
jgi:hypothetical protein